MILRSLMVVVAIVATAPTAAPRSTSSVETRLLASEPGESMLFAVGDDAQSFHVWREGITGVAVNLRRSPGHLSGNVGSEPVDLVLASPRISGTIGDHAVSLDVLRSDNQMRIVGHFGARAIALDVQMGRIDGDVGPCSYRLPLKSGRYRGQIACGGEPEPVRLDIPVALVARSDVELAAMLTAVLAR